MPRTLIHGGALYSQGNPGATSMIINDGRVAWIGDRVSAISFVGDVDRVVDLGDAFIAPGFVDAHVHLSSTGLFARGLDLVGVTSAQEALALLAKYAQGSSDAIIMGHGWDDTDWRDREMWNASSAHNAAGQQTFYLTRIDVHSALVSSDLLKEVSATINGYSETGLLSQESHHEVRDIVLGKLSSPQRRAAISAALSDMAAHGIVSVHENAGPHVSGEADFLDVLAATQADNIPEIFAYWGDINLARVNELGAFGAAGDLNVDGSCGSRTALMLTHYNDGETLGAEYMDANDVAEHLIACTRAGFQGGFHAIGDGAMENINSGLKKAMEVLGRDAVRRSRHRIEHAELMTADQLDCYVDAGVVLSMQPVFDELWGGESGMYETRLGRDRMKKMNPFAEVVRRGIPLAFGSDTPVTPVDPWRAVRAATLHHTEEHRISARAAFAAHTRGGWRAVGDDESGVLAVGAPAHFAAWDVDDLVVNVPDGRVRAWSTDERSGTPGLPDLDGVPPKCLLTVRNDVALFDRESLWSASAS